ncbi:MAG: hypothetical protein ACLUEQ_13360 [Cloacibacillus evryensis]
MAIKRLMGEAAKNPRAFHRRWWGALSAAERSRRSRRFSPLKGIVHPTINQITPDRNAVLTPSPIRR